MRGSFPLSSSCPPRTPTSTGVLRAVRRAEPPKLTAALSLLVPPPLAPPFTHLLPYFTTSPNSPYPSHISLHSSTLPSRPSAILLNSFTSHQFLADPFSSIHPAPFLPPSVFRSSSAPHDDRRRHSLIRYCKTTRDYLVPSVWGPVQKGEDPYAPAAGGGGGVRSLPLPLSYLLRADVVLLAVLHGPMSDFNLSVSLLLALSHSPFPPVFHRRPARQARPRPLAPLSILLRSHTPVTHVFLAYTPDTHFPPSSSSSLPPPPRPPSNRYQHHLHLWPPVPTPPTYSPPSHIARPVIPPRLTPSLVLPVVSYSPSLPSSSLSLSSFLCSTFVFPLFFPQSMQ